MKSKIIFFNNEEEELLLKELIMLGTDVYVESLNDSFSDYSLLKKNSDIITKLLQKVDIDVKFDISNKQEVNKYEN